MKHIVKFLIAAILMNGCTDKLFPPQKLAKESGENFILLNTGEKVIVQNVEFSKNKKFLNIKFLDKQTEKKEMLIAFQNNTGYYKNGGQFTTISDDNNVFYIGYQDYVLRRLKGALNVYSGIIDEGFVTGDKFSKSYASVYYVEDPKSNVTAVLTKYNVSKNVLNVIKQMVSKSQNALKILTDYYESKRGERKLKQAYQETYICLDAVKKFNEEEQKGLIR